MSIEFLRDYAMLQGERLEALWRDRDNQSNSCIEFLRLQHKLAALLGVDMPDIDSFTLHHRIEDAIRKLRADSA